MTLEEIEKMDCEFLDIPIVASYLGGYHMLQPLRETIRAGVPWGYVVGKAKFVIPKQAFVNYHKYGGANQYTVGTVNQSNNQELLEKLNKLTEQLDTIMDFIDSVKTSLK